MIGLFKRKPRPKKHTFQDVAILRSNHLNFRALKCTCCGKTFLMDMFGGWAIEWEFVLKDRFKVDPDNMKWAYETFRRTPRNLWRVADQEECMGLAEGLRVDRIT